MNPRPSSLPMVKECGQFEGGTSEFAELGTDRHAALKGYLAGDMAEFDLLDEESQRGIKWAAEYIKLKAPTSDYPLVVEEKIEITYPNFETVHGTPDAVCGPELFDFKWRRRDYVAQMAAYSLPMLSRFDRVRVHLLFGAECREEVYYLDLEACERLLLPILERVGTAEPTPCDYCGWCAKRLTCPAMTGPAKVVALGYGDLAEIATWHPSEMDKAEDIALALTIWRKVLKKWGDSIEYFALEAATKKGLLLPGYTLKERQGKKFITDTQRAFELSGLPAEKFLQACGVRLNSSKTTGELGLDKLFSEQAGSLAAAKRTVDKKLADVISRRKPTLALVADKGESDEE